MKIARPQRRVLLGLAAGAAIGLTPCGLLAQGMQGPAGVINDYVHKLAAHLSKFRKWPPGPRVLEGRVVVRLVIARDGRLLDYGIAQSSGYTTLDAAELETVRRAAPFPPFPPEIVQDKATFMAPGTYRLRPQR